MTYVECCAYVQQIFSWPFWKGRKPERVWWEQDAYIIGNLSSVKLFNTHNFINRRDNPPARGNQVAGRKWQRIGEQQECQTNRWFPFLLSSWAEVQQEMSADTNTAVAHHDIWWDWQWVGCDVALFFFCCVSVCGHTYVEACLTLDSHRKKLVCVAMIYNTIKPVTKSDIYNLAWLCCVTFFFFFFFFGYITCWSSPIQAFS